jgi:hypothetical protein
MMDVFIHSHDFNTISSIQITRDFLIEVVHVGV